jgi:hypothetical protein
MPYVVHRIQLNTLGFQSSFFLSGILAEGLIGVPRHATTHGRTDFIESDTG